MLALVLGAAMLLGATAAIPGDARPAADTTIAAGNYDGELMIGVDPATHRISGYYQSSTGMGQFNCIFYFSGTPGVGGTPIRSYFPETPDDVITGTLTGEARDHLRIQLTEDHGGCWNVRHFADRDQPAEFRLIGAYPWIAVTVVKSARAHFYDSPEAKAPRKSYVVQGDGLGVRAVRPNWLQVDFIGGAKPVSGWIRSADVYPVS